MPVPKIYRKQGERAITSYAYTELADGTGFVIYNLAQTSTTAGNKQILTTKTIYSGASQTNETPMEITDAGASGTFTKRIDKDFDLTAFNSPRMIRGTAVLNLSFRQNSSAGTGESYIIAKARKLAGATETEIASAQTITTLTNTSAKNYWHAIPIVIPLTPFKKGEIFRLTIEVWPKVGTGTNRVTFGCDPMARDGSYITAANNLTTKSTFHLPFNIDI